MPTPEEIYKLLLDDMLPRMDCEHCAAKIRAAFEEAKHCKGSVAPILKAEDKRWKNLRLGAAEALVDAEKSHIWTEISLLGLFYKLYETEVGSSYTLINNNARADMAHITVLVSTLGDLSIFALRAFFSPAMKWVVNKRLDFFSRDNVERFVRPLAHAMAQKDQRRPEWVPGTKARGLVWKPKGG